jgi:hypothetical protein
VATFARGPVVSQRARSPPRLEIPTGGFSPTT